MTNWACHFLIAADNNLREIGPRQVAQLGRANPNQVRVVVQLDIPEARARRFVHRDGKFVLLEPRLGTLKNLRAGHPSFLKNFLFASKRLRPAQHRAVILSSHGTGFMDLSVFPGHRGRGAWALGVDDTSRDFLDNNELAEGLAHVFQPRYRQRKPVILGCDACLMASVEAAHQLREYATYFVASQDMEPATGWPYDRILATFNNSVDPLQAAKNIVRVYGDATSKDDLATLSAVNLRFMSRLASALNRLGAVLTPLVETDIKFLAHAREKARAFANFDSIDLYGFVAALRARRAIRDAANAVLSTLEKAVVATSRNPRRSHAHGLSIYLPNGPVFDAYHDIPLSKAARRWHDFVVRYGARRAQPM